MPRVPFASGSRGLLAATKPPARPPTRGKTPKSACLVFRQRKRAKSQSLLGNKNTASTFPAQPPPFPFTVSRQPIPAKLPSLYFRRANSESGRDRDTAAAAAALGVLRRGLRGGADKRGPFRASSRALFSRAPTRWPASDGAETGEREAKTGAQRAERRRACSGGVAQSFGPTRGRGATVRTKDRRAARPRGVCTRRGNWGRKASTSARGGVTEQPEQAIVVVHPEKGFLATWNFRVNFLGPRRF